MRCSNRFLAVTMLNGIVFVSINSSYGMPQAGIRLPAETAPQGTPAVIEITKDIRQLRKQVADANDVGVPPVRRADPKTDAAFVDRSPFITELNQHLSKKVDFNFHEVPLSDVVDWLSEQLDVNVIFDRSALEGEGVDEQDTITFSAAQLSFKSALRYMLLELNLTYTLDDNLITITSLDVAGLTLRTRVYPVWDLVGPTVASDNQDTDYSTLIHCLTSTIDPYSWTQVGGPGSLGVFKGMLTISQTRETHEQIENLLAAIRMFPATPGDGGVEDSGGDAQLAIDKSSIAGALEGQVDVEFDDARLEDVVDYLQEQSGVNHLFDPQSLLDENVDKDDTVTMHLSGISHEKALELILRDLNLAFVVDEEAVVIVSEDKAAHALRTKVYSCAGLLDQLEMESQVARQQQELIDSLVSNITPNSWDSVGGPGSIVAFPRRGLLIVDQTDGVHRALGRHLRMLKEGRVSAQAAPRRTYDPAEISVSVYSFSERLRDANARVQTVDLLRGILLDTHQAVNSEDPRFFLQIAGDRLIVSHRRDVQRVIASILNKLGAVEMVRDSHAGGGMF